MRKLYQQILFGVVLIVLSALVYFMHYLLFDDAHHIFIYLVGDVAFVFIEVLLVTLIIHRLLDARAKNTRLEKLNMVIGAFFSEIGMELLKTLSERDPQIEKAQDRFVSAAESTEQKFMNIAAFLKNYDYSIAGEEQDWVALKDLLGSKKDLLLRLLENPNLLEHESFSETLRSVFHLVEELDARDRLSDLPETDRKHLGFDVQRIYGGLALQWLDYAEHLKNNYPYLFSLTVRMNPFDRSASPIVEKPYS